MNEQQYREVCAACDRVLLEPDSTIERVAISWLHVIREHPVYLANYVDLFEPSKGSRAIVRKLWRFFRSRAAWFLQLLRSLRADGHPWSGPVEFPRGVDILFVSHLLNPTQAGQADDFYFDGLPNEMVERGHSALIALINHSVQADAYLVDKWSGSLVPRVILSGSLRFLEEVAFRRRLKKESLHLGKLVKNEAPGLARCVLARASEEALAGGSLTNLRMASQIGALVAKLQPKVLIVTHEGHAWERMAFATARKAFSGVWCIGYQHAALFRLQHAIRRNLGRGYNPDQILTAGTVSKAKLASAPGLKGIPISVLGSNRSFKGAKISSGCMMHPGQVANSGDSACLVLPEGIASECHLLLEFSLACAEAFPEIQFIWRLHLFVTHGSLTAQNPRLRNLPRNVVLSQATLEDDIARCRCALYRGTTAIVQAVVAGLRPIYLKLPGEMTIDPLYELKDWRLVIRTPEEFIQAINISSDDKNGGLKKTQQKACNYCEKFYEPLNGAELVKALSPP